MRLALPVLFLIAACSSAASVATESDAVTSSVGSAGDYFLVTAYGSGNVAIGATCAPGDESTALDFARMTIVRTSCESGRIAHYQGTLVQAERDAFNVALRTTTDTTAQPCVLEPVPFYELSVWAGAGSIGNWTSECDNARNVRRADGLTAVLVAANADEVAPHPLPATNLAAGTSLWSDGATSLRLDLFGHGSTPVGSSCVPGARSDLLLADETGANFEAARITCTLQDSGMYRTATTFHTYARADLDPVFALLDHPDFTPSACDSAKDTMQLRVSHGGADATQFASPSSVCSSADVPYQPLANIGALAAALDALIP